MKKLKSGKKIFLGLSIGVIVSLATIGFSTWIISIEEPKQDFTISVDINDLSFETILVNAELTKDTKTITCAPTNISGDGIVSGNNTSKEDLSIPVSGSLIIAKEQQKYIQNVSVNLVALDSNNQDANVIEVGPNDPLGREQGTYKYFSTNITEVSSFTFNPYQNSNKETLEGFLVADLKLDNLAVTYGSFFDDGDSSTTNNPENFYGKVIGDLREQYIADKISAEKYLTAIKTAQDEITTMQNSIKKILIEIKGNTRTGN